MAQRTAPKSRRTPEAAFIDGLQQAGYTSPQSREIMDFVQQLRNATGDDLLQLIQRLDYHPHQDDIYALLERWEATAEGKQEISQLTSEEITRIAGAASGPRTVVRPTASDITPSTGFRQSSADLASFDRFVGRFRESMRPIPSRSIPRQVHVRHVSDREFEVTIPPSLPETELFVPEDQRPQATTYRMEMPEGFQMPTTLAGARRLMSALRDAALDFYSLQQQTPRPPISGAVPRRTR